MCSLIQIEVPLFFELRPIEEFKDSAFLARTHELM